MQIRGQTRHRNYAIVLCISCEEGTENYSTASSDWLSSEFNRDIVGKSTECPALSENKMKQYVSLNLKCVGEIDTCSNSGPTRASYLLTISQYGHH
jgi:hypothetical protein